MMTIRGMSGGKDTPSATSNIRITSTPGPKLKPVFGEAAKALGLTGQVTNEQFERLRECEHPESGEFLRQRRGADRLRADGSKQSEERACST